jgi:hypothetical protein
MSVRTTHDTSEDLCVPNGEVCGPADPGKIATPGTPPSVSGLSGSVGPTGGSVSKLYFAVVGDTRPAVPNDTAGYPTAIINKIYDDIAGLSPMPSFAVASGDYMFTLPVGSAASTQLDLYLAARARYSGTVFAALGNHECTGATASNCGTGNRDGVTTNYSAFLSKMLAPIGQTKPYYSFNVNAIDHSWTAKFVVIAANAWDHAQETWLESALSPATTYTFIVRHEPAHDTQAPGVSPSETIMARHPYTLAIVGHTHTYGKTGARQVTIGNGGAPLSGSANYGFGLVSQRDDGAIQVDVIDYMSGNADLGFRFALKADGSPAP